MCSCDNFYVLIILNCVWNSFSMEVYVCKMFYWCGNFMKIIYFNMKSDIYLFNFYVKFVF